MSVEGCQCQGHSQPQDPDDEPFSLTMGAYPRGRCDTCGKPCCDESGECTIDVQHITALTGFEEG